MKVTFQESIYMGYIYLSPPLRGGAPQGPEAHTIPVLEDLPEDLVRRLRRPSLTYVKAVAQGVLNEGYHHDKTGSGYLLGLEEDMRSERMDQLERDAATSAVTWEGVRYDVLLLRPPKEAFASRNWLYAMNDARDAYVVLRRFPVSKGLDDLGAYFEVTAVLSARPDLYPVDFWSLRWFERY